MDILKEIFKGREVTIGPTGASISKWSRYEKEVYISIRTVNYLINCDVLVLDSGNFETGEQHYVYNDCRQKDISDTDPIFEQLKPILREVRLNKLVKEESKNNK